MDPNFLHLKTQCPSNYLIFIRFHHEILEVGWLEPLLFQLGFLFQRLHAWRSLTLARAAVFRGRTFGNPKGKMEGTLIQQVFCMSFLPKKSSGTSYLPPRGQIMVNSIKIRGGGFKDFFKCSPPFGENDPIWRLRMFSDGLKLNHPTTN